MKLFGFFHEKENEPFRITEADQFWVEENFRWLIKAFGYPYPESEQILISEIYFPKTFKADNVSVENIIKDLCTLLQIQEKKISYDVVYDLRDSVDIPYQIEGKPFETAFEIEEGIYKIYIANSLCKQNKRLVYNLVYEFIRIKLAENKLRYETGDDAYFFVYLAGIYLGFGVLLSQKLRDTGRKDDGFWETKWNYISDMPYEIMAYALATYSKLIEQDSSKWKKELPTELKNQFTKALQYLEENPTALYNKQELEANNYFKIANDLYQKNKFEEAITNLQNTLQLTNDDGLKADVYNNLGYFNLRLKNYDQSVPHFKNSIELLPEYGYANDNLGYAFIQLGELEEGKKWLEKALETENNDIAYTFRNFALYYQAKGEIKTAEAYFKKSFDSVMDSVDLLEYHYSDFLIQNGEREKGLTFLKKAVDKGEPEAIEKMKKIRNNQP